MLGTPHIAHWLDALEREMKSLQEKDVWELVELPQGRKPVGSESVFKTKKDADGQVEWYKAWLVV